MEHFLLQREQILHFPYFQTHDISKASKGIIMEYRVNSENGKIFRKIRFDDIFNSIKNSDMFQGNRV